MAQTIKFELVDEVKKMENTLSLAVVIVGNNPVTARFVRIKEKFAQDVGIQLKQYNFSESVTTDELIENIKAYSQNHDGIIIQLPLPSHLDEDKILNSVPVSHDIDMLSENSKDLFKRGESKILPPVIGAFDEILFRNNVNLKDKKVIIIGKGKLVGKPASIWFEQKGADVSVLRRGDNLDETKNADIIVLGAGVPGLLKGEMVKDSVIILDAGTSEEEGDLLGDADKSVCQKASIFTPVPGGIGPITVAVLFKNLLNQTILHTTSK